MNFVPDLTPSVAAGAVLAATLLVVFGGDAGVEPAAAIQACAAASDTTTRDAPMRAGRGAALP